MTAEDGDPSRSLVPITVGWVLLQKATDEFSQSKVARRSGVSTQQIHFLCKRQRRPSLEVAAALEKSFRIPCSSWLEEPAEMIKRNRHNLRVLGYETDPEKK